MYKINSEVHSFVLILPIHASTFYEIKRSYYNINIHISTTTKYIIIRNVTLPCQHNVCNTLAKYNKCEYNFVTFNAYFIISPEWCYLGTHIRLREYLHATNYYLNTHSYYYGYNCTYKINDEC